MTFDHEKLDVYHAAVSLLGVASRLMLLSDGGNFRRARYRGRARTQLCAYFVAAAHNLVRIAKLTVGFA